MNQPSGAKPELVISTSRHFVEWLASQQMSLGVTTYQAGKLFLIGHQPNGRLSVFERTFSRSMGLHASADAQTLWMASLYQIWRFENYVPEGQATADGYDRLYVPTMGFTTGDIDVHDLHVPAGANRPLFAATHFNCVATVSETHSFRPVWRPPFISALAPEDRCHLNGLALDPVTGEPAYVTMVSRSDVADGWRDRRRDGGYVMDVRTGEFVAEGLAMPHSPRLDPLNPRRLWLVEAGTGYVGFVDLDGTGGFQRVAFCPGFARGLSFAGDHILVGMSMCRENRTFADLPLEDNLKANDVDARCAIHVIDTSRGTTAHWLRFEGVVRELYDVVGLPGVRRPKLLGFKTDEIRRTLRIEGE